MATLLLYLWEAQYFLLEINSTLKRNLNKKKFILFIRMLHYSVYNKVSKQNDLDFFSFITGASMTWQEKYVKDIIDYDALR